MRSVCSTYDQTDASSQRALDRVSFLGTRGTRPFTRFTPSPRDCGSHNQPCAWPPHVCIILAHTYDLRPFRGRPAWVRVPPPRRWGCYSLASCARGKRSLEYFGDLLHQYKLIGTNAPGFVLRGFNPPVGGSNPKNRDWDGMRRPVISHF